MYNVFPVGYFDRQPYCRQCHRKQNHEREYIPFAAETHELGDSIINAVEYHNIKNCGNKNVLQVDVILKVLGIDFIEINRE
jgi:hypothetical protein